MIKKIAAEQWKIANGLLCLRVPTLNGHDLLTKIRSLFTTASSVAIPAEILLSLTLTETELKPSE
jgi:hypothetical protein